MKFGACWQVSFSHNVGRIGRERRQLMSRMKIIALDVHCSFCQGGAINSLGKELAAFKVPTSIPALVEQIESERLVTMAGRTRQSPRATQWTARATGSVPTTPDWTPRPFYLLRHKIFMD